MRFELHATVVVTVMALGLASTPARAQGQETAAVPAGEPADAQEAPGAAGTESDGGTSQPPAGPSDLRIGIQARLTALNVVLVSETAEAGEQVPLATLGLRFLDQRLFAGLGFGLFGVEGSDTGISVTPLASFDILRDADLGAIYSAAWLSFANFNDSRALGDDNVFVWGLSAVAGVRIQPVPGLGVGAEWGWGFVSLNRVGSNFAHGFIGNFVLEATFGV